MLRYDVFLSHASADKPAVEHLARKLRDAGIEPFLDIWCLVGGKPWQEELEEAVHQSGCCAVFFGPASKGGAWRIQETQLALARAVQDPSFRVIPVLLPKSKKDQVAGFLSLRTWVDFRGGLDDAGALARLIASIRAEPPGPGETLSLSYRCMAPAREPFVQRSEYAKVRDALLLAEAGGSGRATTVGITTAIHGAGGFGKTAVAIELCYDDKIRGRYPDGILWTTMGEEIDAAGRLARVRDLIRWWTEKDPPAFETVFAASAHLRQELEGQRVFLVVDDVWRPEDVTPFQGLGPGLLVTTRDSRTLPAESAQIHVDALELPEAVRLLGAGLPGGTETDLRRLAKRLGEWPLLLKIVHRQLKELIQRDGLSLGRALQEVEEALDAEGLTAFDREDLEARNQAVARTVGASLRRLSRDEAGWFEQLAIFPEDKDIPLLVLEKLWGLGSFAAKKLCGRLHDLSLLLRFDRQSGTIRLHDVIRTYLLKRGEPDLAKWHRRLLDVFRPASGIWSDLPREESYLWNHLFHHLASAGQDDLCRHLLWSFPYLRSKLEATDVNALLADFVPFAESDRELRLVRDALRLSAHVLTKTAAQLAGQLLGRLLDRQEGRIQRLLRESEAAGRPRLRPHRASLTRPGGALIRTFDHPGRLRALAVLPDGRVITVGGTIRVWDVESGQTLQTFEGRFARVSTMTVLDSRRVVSGSEDGTLRVWDVESGQTLQNLVGHSSRISAVAVLDSHRVVSSSFDTTLRVWDVESGQTLQTLSGHSSWVGAVAVLDSRRVVSGSSAGTLRVWDVESGQTLQTLNGHHAWVRTVAVLDSCRVVSGSDDETLRVWDAESGQTLQTLKGHSGGIIAVAVLDNCRVISGSSGGSSGNTLRVWDVESGQTLQTFDGHSAWVRSVAVLDSRRVVSGSVDGTLRVWDVQSGEPLQALEGHSDEVSAVAVLDSHQVFSSSIDGTLRVWGVESGQTFQILQEHSAAILAMAVFGSRQVMFGSHDGTVRVWDVASGQTLQTLEGPADIGAVAVLDSRRVVAGSIDTKLRVWDVKSGQTLLTLEGHFSGVNTVVVLDSRRVVSGSDDRTLRVWAVESGQSLQILEGHSDKVSAVAVLDSRRVVSGSFDRTLRVWDVESGQKLQTLEGHSEAVRAVAVLDSRRVVSGSSDWTLRVWDVESGVVECLFTLDSSVTAVAVIPDRRVIVAGDSSGQVHFFDFVEG